MLPVADEVNRDLRDTWPSPFGMTIDSPRRRRRKSAASERQPCDSGCYRDERISGAGSMPLCLRRIGNQ